MSCNRSNAIRAFFNEIIRLSHSLIMMEEAIAGGGYPLSGLVNNFTSRGNRLVKEIMDDTSGEGYEFRLNNAGLKLYWRLDHEHDLLKVSIGGDQAKNYPRFVAAVRQIIECNTHLR